MVGTTIVLTRQVRLGLGPETEAELWYFGNMFVTESNDGYVVVDGVDGTMQQEALGMK